ncbi:hypothetical protein [Mangrovibacterium marinum]|uniref:DUF4350 domain-containing protein n=1 Tax=Mangrovibacterium marinum TaxID=1639118 RepID=A0A2T5BZ95_9BACT|nr:hypothetical protein [Mangrovibacterium marinum]PTN07591.1 hypothetical protein C8N47_11530 [Mangrovibacterium marinum]
MNSKLKYGVITGLLLGILVYLESIAPRQTDWTTSYSKNDKIPYGSWVMQQALTDLFPGTNIRTIEESFYQHWNRQNMDSSSVIIVTSNFEPDSLDLDLLFRKAAQGDQIFIASQQWPKSLSDSLKFNSKRLHSSLLDSLTLLQVQGKAGWSEPFAMKKLVTTSWFELPENSPIDSLGLGNGKLNFMAIPYGKGSFLLHSQPLVFTNYHILYNDHSYLERVLSRITPRASLEWDEYYKPLRQKSSSPMKVILSVKALRAAYWLLLIALLLYILSNIRRRQRTIPVLQPKVNLSLHFVETIGMLYHNRKDHKDLVKKIFTVFAEQVTTRYFIRIDFSNSCSEKLANKSGVSDKTVTQLFNRYQILSKKEQVYDDELMRFNNLVETFYRESRQAKSQNTSNHKN